MKDEKLRVFALSEELENPQNVERFRFVGGFEEEQSELMN